jgi:hypothetical protein
MGGSDYDSDASVGSARSYGSAGSKKKYKKDKKDKKEKKDKDHKDKDKKDKKDKDGKDKEKDKDKKDKKDKDKDKHKDDKDKKHSDQPSSSYSYGQGQHSSTGPISVPAFNPNYPGALAAAGAGAAVHGASNLGTGSYHNPVSSSAAAPAFPSPPVPQPSLPHPSNYPGQVPNMSYQQQTPPSGYRTPLDSKDGKPFPTNLQDIGPPVTRDLDGSPIYIGSVLFDNAVHPCKIGPHLSPPAQVAYGGVEQGHHGRYDLLPFVPEQMEWVHTSHGRIPPGKRPVEGGYEQGGEKLYHALVPVQGVKVPGKTGEHL